MQATRQVKAFCLMRHKAKGIKQDMGKVEGIMPDGAQGMRPDVGKMEGINA